MANVTVAEHIKASPEKVWEVIGKFDAIHKWAPGIKESKAEGVGIGARRTLTFNGGGRITERLISKAENPPAYTYSIEQGDLPVNNHISTLMVVDHGDGSCTVSWVCTFEPQAAANEGEVRQVFGDFYRTSIASLKKRFG
jgi:uncharacterized protein YndB with AHSA1/START domain